ncbi:hypothetical protein [Hymenobacter canadensis]|uniref:Uncharacterized protein n=1 Tax=Hymenobacter canadensis TaxID=2999067 RepID=A0ABY7LXC8_9BACT|nr:hypothetical protein [Hymenobacter canadensis]WBA44176.1 hypothetical protein O3303_20020 [Hymenobacter canadensis]
MKKLFIGFLLLAALGYGLYALVFDRANHIYSKLPQVKAGMSRVEVTALLGVPDTTYAWPEAPYPPVLHYEMGLGAPDDLRVFLDHDSVTAWSYNQ